jgi:hypothetical protein
LGDHVGLEEAAFEEDVLVLEGLEDEREDSFGDLLADLDGVGSVAEDFGLNDGDESVILADGGVSGEAPGVLLDGQVGWAAGGFVDLEDSSPLGESAAEVVELLAHVGKRVQSLGGGLSGGEGDILNTLVNLDPWNDASLSKELAEVLSVLGGLFGGFGEEDNS